MAIPERKGGQSTSFLWREAHRQWRLPVEGPLLLLDRDLDPEALLAVSAFRHGES